MQFTVGKEFTFQAAHQLPLHDGKCKYLHGHSYRVAVEVTGPVQNVGPKSGMVIDFGVLSAFWHREVEPQLDHRFLNDTLPIEFTTAELIAAWVFEQFSSLLGGDKTLAVQVWETPTSWARVS